MQLQIPLLKDHQKAARLCTLYKITHGFSHYPPLQSKQERHPTFLAICTIGQLPSLFARTCQYKNQLLFPLILFVYAMEQLAKKCYFMSILKVI